jgi:flagellin-like protein
VGSLTRLKNGTTVDDYLGVTRESRGASSVIGVILMVALVVILAAVISTFSFGFVDSLREPAPNIAKSSGAFVPQDGNDGGIVLLTHEAGDSVRIEHLEIAVQAECNGGAKQGRIVNLPAGAGNAIRASDGQIEGDNIFDERSLNTIDNVVPQVNNGGALLKTQYTAGSTILFRIPKNKCELTSGSEVTVRIIHTPSQSVIIEKRLTA